MIEKQILAIIDKMAPYLGSRDVAWLWLGIKNVSMGKTPYQAIIDGQGDMVMAYVDEMQGPNPPYS